MATGTVYVNIDFTSRSFAEYNVALTDNGGFFSETISTPTTDYSYSYGRDDATECKINVSLTYLGSNTTQVHPVPVITYEPQGDDMYITVTWTDGVGVIVNIDFTSYDFSSNYIYYSSVGIDPSFSDVVIENPTSNLSKFYSVASVSDSATISFSGQPDGLTPVVTRTTDDDGFIVFDVVWDDGTGVDMWVTGTLYVYTNGAWTQAQMYRHNGAEFVSGTPSVFTRYISPMTTTANTYGATVVLNNYTTETNDYGTTVVIG